MQRYWKGKGSKEGKEFGGQKVGWGALGLDTSRLYSMLNYTHTYPLYLKDTAKTTTILINSHKFP